MAHPALNAASMPGFADPVIEAQQVFRAVMNALARPTQVQALDLRLSPPSPLTPGLAAIALALADGDAPLWLDAPLAADPAVAAYLRFHTGAPIVAEPALAAFALIADPAALVSFDDFALGTEDYPDRSTTIVLAVDALEGGAELTLQGPGMREPSTIAPTPVPAQMRQAILDNRTLFPRGMDFVFVTPRQVAALPRSSSLAGGR